MATCAYFTVIAFLASAISTRFRFRGSRFQASALLVHFLYLCRSAIVLSALAAKSTEVANKFIAGGANLACRGRYRDHGSAQRRRQHGTSLRVLIRYLWSGRSQAIVRLRGHLTQGTLCACLAACPPGCLLAGWLAFFFCQRKSQHRFYSCGPASMSRGFGLGFRQRLSERIRRVEVKLRRDLGQLDAALSTLKQ